jgi:hypothetical protein
LLANAVTFGELAGCHRAFAVQVAECFRETRRKRDDVAFAGAACELSDDVPEIASDLCGFGGVWWHVLTFYRIDCTVTAVQYELRILRSAAVFVMTFDRRTRS